MCEHNTQFVRQVQKIWDSKEKSIQMQLFINKTIETHWSKYVLEGVWKITDIVIYY